MARLVPMLVMAVVAPLSMAQDSAAVARLELEVRQLQRELFLLSQRVNLPGVPPPAALPPLPRAQAATPAPAAQDAQPVPRWINATRWQTVRPGMSGLAVVSELGPPTSMRGDDARRVLMYALEIGPSGFLAGSVTLEGDAVTAVEIPTLK
jgi:hypothetical protein